MAATWQSSASTIVRVTWAAGSLGRGGEPEGKRIQRSDQLAHIRGDALEARTAPEARLIEIKAAVDLDLEGVDGLGGPAVMLGDIAAGIGIVARHRIAETAQRDLHLVGQCRRASAAAAIAEHEIDTLPSAIALQRP